MRGLTKENAERVGLHLIMAGRLIDVDPETAYLHAQAAVRRAGRIDVVREAAGLTAYRTGRYAEALRELRTVRRLNGSSEHLPLMADAERGLGRPERAIALAATPEAETLDAAGRTELAIVVSGARSDLGEHDAALAVLDKIPAHEAPGDLGLRVLQARSIALEAAGRPDEAQAILAGVDPEALARATGEELPEEDVVVYDVYDDEADDDEPDDIDGPDDDGPDDDEPEDEEPDADLPAAPAPERDENTTADDEPPVEIPGDAPEPTDAEIEAEVAEILAEAGVDDEADEASAQEPGGEEPDGEGPSEDAPQAADATRPGDDTEEPRE
ncbi:hypothetical protein [Myceligenerans crystallogenes]|uniref:Tetratricopeptide repeat-containing protein n=1 Tax=Myceligenerans crystallogenes TaxID=316335 RepID=A0ABN2NIB9_9MICO